MSTEIELATSHLFDADALGATNVKLFPGSSRDVTAEQYAVQINSALAQIEAGDFEFVGEEEECA
jgi:hypothetical protein